MKIQEDSDLFKSTGTKSSPKHNLDAKKDISANFTLELLLYKISVRAWVFLLKDLVFRLHHTHCTGLMYGKGKNLKEMQGGAESSPSIPIKLLSECYDF